MQGYFNFCISKPLLAYVEEGGFNVKIPRRQKLPTGRNIQGRLKTGFILFRRPLFDLASQYRTRRGKHCRLPTLCPPLPL